MTEPVYIAERPTDAGPILAIICELCPRDTADAGPALVDVAWALEEAVVLLERHRRLEGVSRPGLITIHPSGETA